VNVLARVDFATAREIALLVTDLYAKEEIDSVYIVFSEFKTVMTPNLVVTKLLPVEAVRADEESAAEKESAQVDYIYEQPEEQLLASCSRATSKRSCSARCSNLPRRSTRRA